MKLPALVHALIIACLPAATIAGNHEYEPLARQIDEMRQQANVPALGLVILDNGRPMLLRTMGTASTTTPFRWGSITKTFHGHGRTATGS